MDNITEKIETAVNKVIAELEAKPIATTFKIVVVVYVLKQVLKFLKS